MRSPDGADVRWAWLIYITLVLTVVMMPGVSWGLASNNIPLDSPIYEYIDKLSGMGLIDSDIHGIKPYSKAEAARLLVEAEDNMGRLGTEDGGTDGLAAEILDRLHYLLPREADLYGREDLAPAFDANPSSFRLRYIYLDGRPRDFDRTVFDPGGEGIFGIGHVRPKKKSSAEQSGVEGTPLFENNEGVVYQPGNNIDLRATLELYGSYWSSALAETRLLSRHTEREDGRYVDAGLNSCYLKLGGGGLELEAGRDANWLGQGFRHTLVLSNNARNMDLLKLSSPEPLKWKWLVEKVGWVKYSVIVSRLDKSGSGEDERQPWLIAYKLAVKFAPNFELGVNVSRQTGGPNVHVGGGAMGLVFGGVENDGSNFIGGFDLRYRIPWLRNTTVYFEYAGEDNELFWPTVESYVAGVYIPRLTSAGRDDLRFEFKLGKPIEYTDFQFPEGYTDRKLTLGDSQGGDTKEYFVRYTHYFTLRNSLALEYFHTERGRLGRIDGQRIEEKDAGRAFVNLALTTAWGVVLNYGYEDIRNFNLVGGAGQQNHLFRVDLTYRY